MFLSNKKCCIYAARGVSQTPNFYSNNEVDPLVIIREYKTYYGFLESMEKANYCCTLTEQEKLILEYLSKTILSGVRPEELEILQLLLRQNTISIETFQKLYQEKYRKNIMEDQVNCALEVLQGKFVSNEKHSYRE